MPADANAKRAAFVWNEMHIAPLAEDADIEHVCM